MRVISTRTHWAIDYLTGAGLLVAPALLEIFDEPAAARSLRAALRRQRTVYSPTRSSAW